MTTRSPAHLGKAGREFWKKLTSEYDFGDSAETALVVAASECLDRMDEAKTAIKKHGAIVTDRYGQPKVNPACELERREKSQFLAVLKQLGLEGDDTADRRYSHSRHKRNGPKKANH